MTTFIMIMTIIAICLLLLKTAGFVYFCIASALILSGIRIWLTLAQQRQQKGLN